MARLTVFNFITLNGYYKGPQEDISWHTGGEDEGRLADEGSTSGSILLFGRVTYEHMAAFWPTPQAIKMFPVLAEGMNKAEKIVFSRTLKNPGWNNTRLIKDNIVEEIRKLKKQEKDMTIMGSGSIINQFTEHGLIDEYQFLLDPVAIGTGTPIFHDIKKHLELKLTNSKVFRSGAVLLNYQPH